MQLALSVRGGCIGMLYAKSLSMHTSHRHAYSSGRISNLASVDSDSLMNFMWSDDSTHAVIAALSTAACCVLISPSATLSDFCCLGVLCMS